jgi:hypothetical protein
VTEKELKTLAALARVADSAERDTAAAEIKAATLVVVTRHAAEAAKASYHRAASNHAEAKKAARDAAAEYVAAMCDLEGCNEDQR